MPKQKVNVFLALAACLLLSGASAQAQTPPTGDKPQVTRATAFTSVPVASLAADSRLQASVSVSERGIALAPLCRQLQEATTITIECDKEVAKQRLHLRFRHQPLYKLMDAVAELLPAIWTRTDTGYKLVRQEEALRYRRSWWRLMNSELEGARLEGKRAFLSTVRRPPPDLMKFAPGDRAGIASAEKQNAFWRNLPAATQERIASSFETTAFYRRSFLFYPATHDGGFYLPTADLSAASLASYTTATQELRPVWEMNTISGCLIESRGGSISACLIDSEGKLTGMSLTHQMTDGLPTHVSSIDHKFLEYTANHRDKVPRLWTQLIAFQNLTFWRTKIAEPFVTESKEVRPVPYWLSDVWSALAEKHDLDFVSDYYSEPCQPLSDARRDDLLKQALPDALNGIAAGNDVSWKKRGNLYLCRNNRWYRDDMLEADPQAVEACLKSTEPLFETARKESKEEKAFWPDLTKPHLLFAQMERAAYIRENFDLWQTANGVKYWVDEAAADRFRVEKQQNWSGSKAQPLADAVEYVLLYPKLCAFYSTLPEPQRQQLCDTGIALRDLTAPQRQAFLTADPRLALQETDGGLLKLSATTPNMIVFGRQVFGNPYGGALPVLLNLVIVPAE